MDQPLQHQWRNIILLGAAYSLVVMMLGAHATLAGLVGKILGGDTLATLPVAAVDLGMLIGVLPASFIMNRWGRQVFLTMAVTCSNHHYHHHHETQLMPHAAHHRLDF